MWLIFEALSCGFEDIISQLDTSSNIAKTIGESAALVCWHVLSNAAKTGQALPAEVFTMPRGAIFHAVDSLGVMAQAAKIPLTEFERKLAHKLALQHYASLTSNTSGESN